MKHDKNISPVGWYVASYLLRFIELNETGNEDPEARFRTWENTVLVSATNLDEAYDKTVAIANLSAQPYKGGTQGVPVQWAFEGVTEVLPVYEELEDGAEIIWSERFGRKLKNIRASVKKRGEFAQ